MPIQEIYAMSFAKLPLSNGKYLLSLGGFLTKKCTDINELENFLTSKNLYAYVIMDEFCNVFNKKAVPNGEEVIKQAISIGGSFNGRIHCVLTGSSTDIRKLCFGKFDLPQKKL